MPTNTIGEDFEMGTYLHILPSRHAHLSTFFYSVGCYQTTQFELGHHIGFRYRKFRGVYLPNGSLRAKGKTSAVRCAADSQYEKVPT